MSIRNKPVVREEDMGYYYCVDYGGNVFAFGNKDEAYSVFKALSNFLGVCGYYEFTDDDANVSGMLHGVIKECDCHLSRMKKIHKDHISNVYDVEKQVKCDDPGCWKTEDLNEDGSIPYGWQEIDDKHYCPTHIR